MHQLVDTEHRK